MLKLSVHNAASLTLAAVQIGIVQASSVTTERLGGVLSLEFRAHFGDSRRQPASIKSAALTGKAYCLMRRAGKS
jgi:hypothetical protein